MSGTGYVAVGFGLVWLLVAAYLAWLGRRLTALRRNLEELEARKSRPGEQGRPAG